IFPSAILPMLTYLLVKELKNAKLLRRKLSFTRTKEENTESDHTTKIVVFMTISSMIAQVPLGIVYVGQGLETSQDFHFECRYECSTVLFAYLFLHSTENLRRNFSIVLGPLTI
ncbi:Protein CBG25022, partial [Caenorhabditis briggsae]